MNIAVIGSGYVGLVSGGCFADLGNNVVCVDIDEKKIKMLNEGKVPIYEPGLEELIKKNMKEERLSFTTNLDAAVNSSELIFICVGTPPNKCGDCDLFYVENVARQIAAAAKEKKIIVDKSTVPVETGEKVRETLRQNNPHNIEFDVVSNPEFLREGSALEDFMKPDRIVIGSSSKEALEKMNELYKPLNAPIIETTIESAEIIKHASNSFLATKISFINMVANLCDAVNADINEVALGMGLDKRVGKSFLNAGIGYGGSCFPKDVEAFVKIGEKHKCNFSLLNDVQSLNKEQRKIFTRKIQDALWVVRDKKIAILGLAFKPNTDDIREAPAVDIIGSLLEDGAKISAYDPEAAENVKKIFPDIEYCKTPYDTMKNADALVIVTEWDEFKNLDFEKVKKLLKQPLVIDGRNLFSRNEMISKGFNYIGMGI